MGVDAVPILHAFLHHSLNGLWPQSWICPRRSESKNGSEPGVEYAVTCLETNPDAVTITAYSQIMKRRSIIIGMPDTVLLQQACC